MKTASLLGIKNLIVEEVPTPQPRHGQILVAIKSCGVCGSDVHYYNQGRIGPARCVYPQKLGHEAAGVVVESFKGSQFVPGDRVAVEPGLSCHTCEHCITGHYNRCPNVKFFGSPAMQGGFSEYVVVTGEQLEKIPDTMTFDQAAVLEPLGIAYHALKLARIGPTQTVAVFGCGPVGMLTAAMAKVCGAGDVFVVDKLQYRLDLAAKTYGFSHTINATSTDPLKYILDATKGRGVDIAYEATGEQQTFDWTFGAVRIGGSAMIIGIPEVDRISFDPHILRKREMLVQNVRRSNLALKPCLTMVEHGIITIDAITTHRFPLDRIVDAFETVGGYKDGVLRAMIVF